MEKLVMHTPDLTAENVKKIAALFPNCVTEAKDEATGKLKRSIDFDLLRQELSEHIVEGPRERYHLDWPGKREALLAANAPIAKTLRPCRQESVNFDTTKNLFIEGDNLDALKLLQETYLGKVKMIYIDPPYNTGSDFLYPDDFAEGATDYLARSNQIDASGNKMTVNPESNGRFHSDWLKSIYSRVRLAKNLLLDSGIFFASIHDVEVANMRKVCDAVFGERNFLGQITWKARVKPVNIGEAKYRPQKEVEYVLIYQRELSPGAFHPLFTGSVRVYPHSLNGRKYRLATILKSNRGTNQRTTMTFSLGEYTPPDGQRWQAGEDVIQQLNHDGYIEFRDGTPFRRYFEDEEGAEHDPFYCFMESEWASTSEAGKNQLNALLDEHHGFDTVKPVRLIKTLIQSCTSVDQNDIVLDFYAGSGTTAHAVWEVNAADGGNRRHISVQIAEPCDETSRGFDSIAEITKERLRRAGTKVREDNAINAATLDIGFRVLKIDTSNMSDVYYVPDAVKQADLVAHTDNIKPDRTPEDLLFQVLVDWGVDLALPITEEKMAGKTVFFVDGNALAACFDSKVSEGLVKELAKRKPLRAVFRDSGFDSDSTKINVEQIFKLLSPETEVKTL
jgi:adenine-specific DNA-methyltransferase